MSKKVILLFVVLCCLATAIVVLVQSRSRQSSHVSGAQPSQPDTAASPDTTDSDLRLAHSNDSTESVGVRHGLRPTADGGSSVPKEAVKESSNPKQSAAPLPVQTAAMRQPEAVSSQQVERQAEVWSYPPLLQQNASNNFVRAMEKLAGATSESDRYRALGAAAKSDFIYGKIEDARSYATELLSLDEKFKGEPWRDGSAVYDGNFILGRIAAQEGRIEEAKQYLLEAGKSTGSPVLGSFGPNMSLAKDLLQDGARDTVLEYFDLCRKFWTIGNEKLTLWSEDVKAGRMPDFEANLLY